MNAAHAIHIAEHDSVPLILFVGQVGTDMKGREAFQELDYRAVFGSMAKWVVEVDRADPIPELLSRAWTVALSGRPGPVVMALPEDMLTSLTGAAPLTAPVRVHEPAADAGASLVFEGLRIDVSRRAVSREGGAVELTGTEFDLLHLLAREPGRVFSRDDILNQLRGHEAELYTRAVDIVVSRLRKKLEPLDAIKTVRNAGYTLALARLP